MKKTITNYFKYKIMCKLCLKEEIKRIDEVVKSLAIAIGDHQNFLDEMKKDNFKEKYNKEHKKYKDLEKESQEIIEELTAALKKLERENRKLKKERQIES